MTTVTPDGLADALSKIVELEIDEVRKKSRPAVQKAGKAAIKALQAVTPPKHRTGAYASGWKQKIEGNELAGYTTEVYNSEGQMTRWLEYGHHLVYMGKNTSKFVPPYPHLDAGYLAGAAELEAQLGK